MSPHARTRLIWMVILFAGVLMAGRYGPLHDDVTTIKGQHSAAIAFDVTDVNALMGQDRMLYDRIVKEGERRRIAPVNAVIDRVWKAIPGYDGREVEVSATYAKATALHLTASTPADQIPWVYKSVQPQVNLADLPPSPVYRGNSNKRMVGLMINVAWGDAYLPSILDTLDAEHAKATFFLDGSWLAKNEVMAEEIKRRGHELSNHAYTHKNMSQLSDARQLEEINRTETLLKDKLQANNRLFAPPSGDFDSRTVRIAAKLGLTTVLWTLDTVDWRKPPAASVVAKVSAQVSAGTLILMHPTPTTKQGLQGIIQAIRAKGLTPGTVSEVLSTKRIEEQTAGAQQVKP